MKTDQTKNLLIWLPLALALAVIGWFGLPKDPPEAPHKTFSGSMGESFEHDPRITVVHDPHGGASHAELLFEGRVIGWIDVVTPPPKNLSPNEVRDAIIEDTKKLCSTNTVSWNKLTNRHGMEFDCFSASAYHEGKTYRYELYTHVEQARTPSVSDTYLRQMLGMHKIYFMISEKEAAAIFPLAHQIIDSFKARRD